VSPRQTPSRQSPRGAEEEQAHELVEEEETLLGRREEDEDVVEAEVAEDKGSDQGRRAPHE